MARLRRESPPLSEDVRGPIEAGSGESRMVSRRAFREQKSNGSHERTRLLNRGDLSGYLKGVMSWRCT